VLLVNQSLIFVAPSRESRDTSLRSEGFVPGAAGRLARGRKLFAVMVGVTGFDLRLLRPERKPVCIGGYAHTVLHHPELDGRGARVPRGSRVAAANPR
jgi:hypothetical protein